MVLKFTLIPDYQATKVAMAVATVAGKEAMVADKVAIVVVVVVVVVAAVAATGVATKVVAVVGVATREVAGVVTKAGVAAAAAGAATKVMVMVALAVVAGEVDSRATLATTTASSTAGDPCGARATTTAAARGPTAVSRSESNNTLALRTCSWTLAVSIDCTRHNLTQYLQMDACSQYFTVHAIPSRSSCSWTLAVCTSLYTPCPHSVSDSNRHTLTQYLQ